ncbi:MAG: PHP domain-containing protein [Bacillota bacterium]
MTINSKNDYFKIDLHTHCIEGSDCSKVSVSETINKLRKIGYNGVLLTDHQNINSYRYYHEHYENSDFLVLCGLEYWTSLGHMLLILPEPEEIFNKPFIDPIKLINFVHQKDGIIGIAHMFHPTYPFAAELLHSDKLEKIIELSDFIEVENGAVPEDKNIMALEIAEKYNKAMTSGSDSHSLEDVGKTATIIKRTISNEKDLISAIRNKEIIKPDLK